ncbi:hypothetical protein CPB86DRAFT_280515 [Serendipita vermifera]|nr:hypothetical protein CPB86DRAFT_280515 [Serendipita vermifera]
MENPSAYIDVALHQYFVGVFKLDFRSPSPHVKRHASQRPIDERHVDMLYNSFKESIDRLPALPLLGILGGSAKLPSTIELGSPIIFPKEVDLFIFSGQHRIKALERLAQDPDQKENAWWLVNVYSAELERNLPYHFELLVVRENHQAPKILREVHTIDLFRMCQRLANEPGHLTLRALRGGNIDQKKAKISSTEERNSSPMEKNEISPRYEGGDSTKSKETVRDFAKGFLSCLEYPIVLEGVEKIMETPIFHHYFNLYGFHCSLYPRMYNLVRAILNEVHQFWARLLENEENSQIMASRLNNLPKNNKTFQWVRKNWKINTSIVEKGPEGLEPLRVNSSNEPDWVFGDIVPLPSWVSGSGFREIVERSSRMADMAKLALGLELPTLEGVHKEREIILQTMGEKRAKFEFDCYRYSNLINSKEKDIESEFEKIWKQPRFREFMECCPHPKAKMWLSKRKTAIRLDYIPKQTIEGIPHFAVQGKYAGDLNETLDSSPSTLADSSIDRRTIGAITTTNGIPNLSKGVQDVPVVPAHQNSQETISIQSVLPGTMIRLSEHETPKTADTEPTQANALQSTQSRRHQEISPSHSLPDINSQYNVPAVEWRTIIDKISGYDLPLQIRLHDVLQRMTELADTDLYVLIQMIKDSILHNEAMVMMESLEHKTLNQNELSVSFSASSLSGMKRKRDQDDDLPLTTMSGFQSTLNSGLESMVRDCGVIDWDRHRIDVGNSRQWPA